MSASNIRTEIAALETSLETIDARAQIAKDSVVSGGNAPVYDAGYIQGKIDYVDAEFMNMSFLRLLSNETFSKMVEPFLREYVGPIENFGTVPASEGVMYYLLTPAVYSVNVSSTINVYIEGVPDKKLFYFFYIEGDVTATINFRLSDGTSSPYSVTLAGKDSLAVVSVDDVDLYGTVETTDMSMFGSAFPFRLDSIMGDVLTTKPSIGSYTRSVTVGDKAIGDSTKQRNDLYGTIAADSAPYLPVGSAEFENGQHFTYVSDLAVSVDRDNGLMVGSQHGVKTTLSPEYELLSSVDCSMARSIHSYHEDGRIFSVLGASQNYDAIDIRENAKLSIYEYTVEGSLNLVETFNSYGSGSLEIFTKGNELRIAEFQYRKDSNLDAPIRVFDFDTNTLDLKLLGNSSMRHGSAGSVQFDVNGTDYFMSWPHDSAMDTRLFQLDDYDNMYELTIPDNIKRLRNLVTAGSGANGLPLIFGTTALGIGRAHEVELDPIQGIAIKTTPTNVFTPGEGGMPADHFSRQVLTFKGSDRQNILISTPMAINSPNPETPHGVIVSSYGMGAGTTLITTMLGKASRLRSFQLDGYTYILAIEPGPMGSLKIIRHITDATFELALTIDLTNPIDVTYLYSDNVHILSVLSDGGTKVHTYEFRTDKSMLNWRRSSFRL